MNPFFEGKVAVVTGAGRGIGRATAALFGSLGSRVVVNDLGGAPTGGGGDAGLAEQVARAIRAAGGEAVANGESISSMRGGQALIDQAMDEFGRVDFLINNAGIIRPANILDMTEEDFDLVMNVNLKGYFATVKAAAPHLVKRGGAIVNTGSPSAWGHWGMSNYAAAKEGALGFTRSIARDLGNKGVRANLIRPVQSDTSMRIPAVYQTIEYQRDVLRIPYMSHMHLSNFGIDGRPEDVAAANVWLCGPWSAPLNGVELYCNGPVLSLVQEPELVRTQFSPDGWTLEKIASDPITRALTYDRRNRYLGTEP